MEGFHALPVDLGDGVLDFWAFGFHGLFVIQVALQGCGLSEQALKFEVFIF